MEQLQTLRGMVDLLPEATARWQWLEAIAREHFRRACVQEIRTPLLEATELFARGIGEATDVVGKEMYSFQDRGERSCTLRPEGTASVVRAAIQHGLLSQGPQKLWYGGPMFRYERPQGGRQRQFHQIGLECLGFADPRSDVDAIAIAWDLLQALGLNALQLELNSLGSRDDRQIYREALVAWLEQRRDQLDADSQQRLSTNPLRILDSKNPQTQALLQDAPNLEQALSSESRQRYEQVKAGLNALEIPYLCNPRLVRGLDYYGHTAFEITSSALGAQATVCGGGRYDGLVEQLGGSATACVGWAMGLERLMLLLQHQETPVQAPDVVVVSQGETAEALAVPVARQLRQASMVVELDLSGSGFGKQLKRAGKSGARWALLIGEQEASSGQLQLKDLQSGDSRAIALGALTDEWPRP
ncbi:MAG: histidine--tRNA ligase [Synechococcus sp.]|nr:histidine--tRNA ligase [Synechococcus sp.]